jgi:hypothetical protein
MTRTPAGNAGLAKLTVHYSKEKFVVIQSLVLRINPDSYRDGKNRHIHQAENHHQTQGRIPK